MKRLSEKKSVFTKINRRALILNYRPQSQLAMNNTFRNFGEYIACDYHHKTLARSTKLQARYFLSCQYGIIIV